MECLCGFLAAALWSCCLQSVNQNRELKKSSKKNHKRVRQTYERIEDNLKKIEKFEKKEGRG
jgi:hypothetical protein